MLDFPRSRARADLTIAMCSQYLGKLFQRHGGRRTRRSETGSASTTWSHSWLLPFLSDPHSGHDRLFPWAVGGTIAASRPCRIHQGPCFRRALSSSSALRERCQAVAPVGTRAWGGPIEISHCRSPLLGRSTHQSTFLFSRAQDGARTPRGAAWPFCRNQHCPE